MLKSSNFRLVEASIEVCLDLSYASITWDQDVGMETRVSLDTLGWTQPAGSTWLGIVGMETHVGSVTVNQAMISVGAGIKLVGSVNRTC